MEELLCGWRKVAEDDGPGVAVENWVLSGDHKVRELEELLGRAAVLLGLKFVDIGASPRREPACCGKDPDIAHEDCGLEAEELEGRLLCGSR